MRLHARRRELRARVARVTCDRTVEGLRTSEPLEIPIPTDGPLQRSPLPRLRDARLAPMREQRPANRHTHQRTVAGAVLYRANIAPFSEIQFL